MTKWDKRLIIARKHVFNSDNMKAMQAERIIIKLKERLGIVGAEKNRKPIIHRPGTIYRDTNVDSIYYGLYRISR